MSNYVKSTNFAVKDGLPAGDPLKVVKGTELDTEFNNIATAIASKANISSPTFLGTPFAPTASTGTATNQIATTAFVGASTTAERTATATLTNKTLNNCDATTQTAGNNTTKVATTAFVSTAVTNERTAAATLTNKTLTSPSLTGTPTAPTATTGTSTTQLATTAFVQAAIAAAVATTLSAAYPVGSIYVNATNATNPGTLLGFGTWAAFGAGRVPVGFNSGDANFNAAEKIGGSKDAIVVSHTHSFSATTDSQGTHSHQYYWGVANGSQPYPDVDNNGTAGISATGITGSAGAHTHSVSGTTGSTGSSATNANLQPYITVYMWKRTA